MMDESNKDPFPILNDNLRPLTFAGWCQELEFIDWCSDNGIPPYRVRDNHYYNWQQETGIPYYEWEGVSEYCLHVAEQVSLY